MGKRIKRPVERHRYWTEWGGQTGRIAEWHGQQRIATSEEQRAEAEGDRGGAGADRLGPDQRVPQQRLGGRIHGVHHGLLDVGGFGAGVGGRTAPQRAHELVMKTRDLSTDALKIPAYAPNIAATTADTRSAAGAASPTVAGAAAAAASFSAEPTLSKFPAAAVTMSGATVRNDIARLLVHVVLAAAILTWSLRNKVYS